MVLKIANVTIRVQRECNIAAGRNVTGSKAYRLDTNDKTVLLLLYSRHLLLDNKMVLLTFILLTTTQSSSKVEPSTVA